MKAKLLTATILALAAVNLWADSKRTAEFLLSDPKTYEGREVTLDVAMVRPVQWVSPLPDYAFFHAMTIDRTDGKGGGAILVALPTSESAAFAKKYGTDFEGRNNKTTLRGKFMAAGGNHHRKVWIVDTTNELETKLRDMKKDLPEAAFAGEGGPGGRPGRPFRPGAGL
ncbi:MAG: hypothetical protein Fur0032_08960 [Terrimicrobiaceae bacterium]